MIDFLKKAATILILGLLVSCNVHEWPEKDEPGPSPTPPEPAFVPVTLNLKFDTALPLHKEITWSRYGEKSHDIRYTVQIFSGSRSKASKPSKTLTFTSPYSTNPDFSTTISLDDGQYEIFAWADYVDPNSSADKYYNTSDWEYLVLSDRNNHQGGNERRDAFRGHTNKIVVNAEQVQASNTIDVDMGRPMARFEFFATDVDEFLSRESRNRSKSSSSRDPEINLDDYVVVFQYSGFMPSAYNVYTNKPNDAWQNVQFQSEINSVDEGASMGFDYVFVESETSVNMIMAVFDKNGNQVSSAKQVEVPLVRSKNTVVKGEFLSEKGSGGVGIQPGFDGDYNIEIH